MTTEQEFYISIWLLRQGQQCEAPQCPRLPWYWPFCSEDSCRQLAATGDRVAIERVGSHDATKIKRNG